MATFQLVFKKLLQVSDVFLIYITVILIVFSLFTVMTAILMKLLLYTVIHNLLHSLIGLTLEKKKIQTYFSTVRSHFYFIRC